MMQNSGSIYMIFYSYGNDAKGSPTYYKITNPTIFLNYIVSDITRNIVSSTFHGRKFYDEYTDGYSETGGYKFNRARAMAMAMSQKPQWVIKAMAMAKGPDEVVNVSHGSHKNRKSSGSGVGFFYFLFLVLIIILVCWVLGKKY